MGWGTRIIIAYVAGVCFILFFVVKSMMLNTEMVEEDYYSKELAYNTYIESVANAGSLAQPIAITDNDGQVEVSIDSVTAGSLSKGQVHFYNPASEKADKKLTLNPSASGRYFFDKSSFVKGKYIVRVSFELNAKPYFTEQVIFIQ
ncbi:MAG: FixH family protein [Sphingobacteriia bacterium]|nr:FixH family protein [Sphingobacteriia bacterium]